MRCALLLLVVFAVPARADEPHPLPDYFAALVSGTYPGGGDPEATPPRFVFTNDGVVISPSVLSDAFSPLSEWGGPEPGTVVAKSGDGKATWVATDVGYGFACGMPGCDKMVMPEVHAAGLFDSTGHAVAWSVGLVVGGSLDPKQPSARIKPVTPPAFASGVDAGAEAAVAVFKGSLAAPEALAKTVSDRKDAMMYGSEKPEHYVGGAAVKATLRKWQLGFTVRDGIQAGVTASKTTAWVAANVDAERKGDKKATPYRVFAIYDKHGADWQLVLLHFSVVAEKPR
jgi:hypothetical protein